jgi:hypothetical protein
MRNTARTPSSFSISTKPHKNIIRILSCSNPQMLRYRFYRGFLFLLIPKIRYLAIVDISFHSVMEWIVRLKRILAHLGRLHKVLCITCKSKMYAKEICTDVAQAITHSSIILEVVRPETW